MSQISQTYIFKGLWLVSPGTRSIWGMSVGGVANVLNVYLKGSMACESWFVKHVGRSGNDAVVLAIHFQRSMAFQRLL